MSKLEKKGLVPALRFPEFRDAGEWEGKKIGQISETVTAGGTPSTSEKEYWGGGIRWMNSGELNYKRVHEVQGRITENGLRNSSTKIIPKMCILIGLAGQGKTRGTVAMNMVELCINQSIAAIFPNEDSFYSDFLYHNLNNRYDELRSLSAGGEGRGGLNLQIIKSLRVPLPSLKEQQKIADCLTSVDDLITAQTQKLDALKTHKKGLMQQLFPVEGETVPKLRFPEFGDKGGWEEKPLEKVAIFSKGKGVSKSDISPNGKQPCIRYGELYTHCNETIKTVISFTDVPVNELVLSEANDVIIPASGETEEDIATASCVLNSGIALGGDLNIIRSNLNGVFLSYYLNNAKKKEIARLAQGISVVHLYSSQLQRLNINVPGLPEQQKIADCLTSIDELVTAQTQKLDALKAHKKGLMQQLFPAMDDDCVDAGGRAAQDAKAEVST
ncbi:restriction endonuclease subunit S [Nitrosomonas sp. HPC101]|uniref:restriction endonuclease subunit S n=1 Tax=Nitrosomonas sp. HPC101 TaxID=1658667 RepID=UPI00136CC02E|nr:restriction endonuclease subunit S [Nitrosomonas sp. HPC101]